MLVEAEVYAVIGGQLHLGIEYSCSEVELTIQDRKTPRESSFLCVRCHSDPEP